MASLKDTIATQEMELTSTSTAWDMTKQGHQCLEVECQRLRTACSGESSSTLHCTSVLSMCQVVNQYVSLQSCAQGRSWIKRRRQPRTRGC
jgi:hypothetical protein